MKKRVAVFAYFLVLIIFFIAYASAQTCDDTQRIMKISHTNNAHGASYSFTPYTVDICYDDYFQGQGNGAHNSGGTVLRLSSDNNAHADLNNYPYQVQYGKITTCRLVDANTQCNTLNNGNDKYTRILFLSANTNAHIGLGGYTNYGYKICCAAQDDPICNYNGVCDDGQEGRPNGGENKQNCDDCGAGGGGTPRCGDGSENQQSEECDDGDTKGTKDRRDDTDSGRCIIDDSGDSGALMCKDAQCGDGYLSIYGKDGLQDQGGRVDDEECDDGNDMDTDECSNLCESQGGSGKFCDLWIPYTENYDCGDNELCKVQLCENYNLAIKHPEYDKDEIEFRKNCCELDCANVGGGEGAGCAWDSKGEECYAYTEGDDGTQCRLRYEYQSECGEGQTTRQVKIYTERIKGQGECPLPPGCTEWGDDPDDPDDFHTWCSTEIPCPKAIQLPFFNAKNLIIAIAIIAIIYVIYLTRKNARK